jgi:CDP-glucose 4,6-dehydratase
MNCGQKEIHLGKSGNLKLHDYFNGFFKGKTIFVTGHTGFQGSWLSLWLSLLGSNVIGYSLPPPTTPSLFHTLKLKNSLIDITGNINNLDLLKNKLNEHKPDIVFHFAAQSIVKQSLIDPLETFQTNILGTANILEAVRNTDSIKECILMTSDKCYERNNENQAYSESDPLGGNDPYSASKGASEIIINSYKKSYFNTKENDVKISSVRCGNVIGGGDWSPNRIIPDCIRSLFENKSIILQQPHSVRPWQHVLDALGGILLLSKKLWNNSVDSGSWNFGPHKTENISVLQLVDEVIHQWGNGDYKITPSESQDEILMLNSSKAFSTLGWNPSLSFQESIRKTIDWYKLYNDEIEKIENYTISQILDYHKNSTYTL